MEKYFRNEQGELLNIVEHTLDQLEKWPNLKIYIGTDSQDKGMETVYSTCIVYRYGNRGAHYIYYKEKVPKIKALYTRLFEEGVRTIEAWKLLTEEIPVKVEQLEFDYADVKMTKSTPVIDALRGWVIGLNQKATFKSGEQLATKAANHTCRR